ncbi:hypothetical protein PybrP1_009560, partial [[Pythium] brassicae (nom. inval.)]
MSGSEQHATSLDAETSDWQAPLRRRPLPVPPAIAIPPPAVPLELGDAKFSAALGLGVFALSPLASRLPSPLIASAEQQKPLVAELGEPSANDASPVSPAMLMQLQHPRHDAWAFESAPGSLYTMLLHSPQYPDLSYQQQMVAACSPTMAMSPLHLSHLLQLQPDPTQQQQQLGGFGLQASPISIVSRSELHERRSAEYPQLSPMAAFQEQMSGGAGQFAPKPEANFSSPNFTDLMMFGVDGAEAMPLQTSSPASVFRYTLPTMSPHFPGITVKDITLNVLRPHFNKPMAVVAKELGVCITLMKKICRRNGLERWPHRRIRSLVNRISSLQALAANAAEPECRRFQAQIDALRTELSAVIENPNEKSRKAQADAKSRSPLSSMPPVARSFPTFPEASVDAKVAAATGAYQSASVGVRAAKLRTSTPPRVPKRESNGNKRRVGGDAVAGAHTQQPREDAATQSVALADAKRASCGVSVSIPSKKRKSGLQSLRLHAPPPIKIPCRRDIRVRRNSAPEQQHLRALFDSCSLGFGLERPSTTTNASRKRGSISSI